MKVSELRDAFDGPALAAVWSATTGGGAVFLENGRVRVDASLAYPALATPGHDLRDGAAAVRVYPLPATGTYETVLRASVDADNKAEMLLSGGNLVMRTVTGGVTATLPAVAWDPLLFAWWRLRERTGVIYFETSRDGLRWVEQGRRSHTIQFGATNTTVSLLAGHTAAEPSASAYFDSFNVYPPGPTVDRLYARLPEVYRLDEPRLGYPLREYLSLAGASAGELEVLLDRSREVADPLLADSAWLAWMGQLVGVTLAPSLTVAQRRDAVRFASGGWRAGTRLAVADAARSALTGTRYVEVVDHTTDVSNPGAAGQFDVLLRTRGTETPDPAAVLTAVISKNAKPAGVRLYHRTYDASWTTLEAQVPTWAQVEARGSWDNLQETGL